jgi:hypothetical protein
MYKILGGDGKEYGPVSAETLHQWVAEGRANAQTQVQAEGDTGWTALGQLSEFASSAATPPPAVGAPGPISSPLGSIPPGTQISNYLVQSILVTLCCCLPLGIPAIVYAAQVNSKQAAGDIAGARDSSDKAKMWCWIAFGLGLVSNLIIAVIQILALAASNSGGRHF